MKMPSTYTLDTETIKLNAYRLLCLFYANKEIARLSDPNTRADPASQLERVFFAREMTHILLNIAVGLRVLDDQIRSMHPSEKQREAYLLALNKVNLRHRCMLFDEMPLREVCNKIIHASTVEPNTKEGAEYHQHDEYNSMGWDETVDESSGEPSEKPEPIKWEHLSGHIRLGGTRGKDQWWHLLEVPVFVEAITELLEMFGQFSQTDSPGLK